MKKLNWESKKKRNCIFYCEGECVCSFRPFVALEGMTIVIGLIELRLRENGTPPRWLLREKPIRSFPDMLFFIQTISLAKT